MKTVLIVGGSGTLGNTIMPLLLADKSVRRIRVLSRGEHRQALMEAQFNGERIDFILGDVADAERMERACRGVNEVYHLAAIKRVEFAEYNQPEAIKTNIIGTLNVINACIKNNVEKCIFTSSDKSTAPYNLYGGTKLVAELAWIGGNIGNHKSRFSAVRYANVIASQGSVIQKWLENKNSPLELTDPTMTRMWITKTNAAKFVYQCMSIMTGGETFIPRLKSATIKDIADIISDNQIIIGRRQGEKLHEMMISPDEAHLVYETEDMFIRYPEYLKFPFTTIGRKAVGLENGYSSFTAPRFTKDELRAMLYEI